MLNGHLITCSSNFTTIHMKFKKKSNAVKHVIKQDETIIYGKVSMGLRFPRQFFQTSHILKVILILTSQITLFISRKT